MEINDINWIKDLLCKDISNLKSEIMLIDKPYILHIIADNYNWDNGFEIPEKIVENEFCDLGTALLIFYRADGYRILEKKGFSEFPDNQWKRFLHILYDRIQRNDFNSQSISYTPELSKVQLFKLKKNNPDLPSVLLEKSLGKEIHILKYSY